MKITVAEAAKMIGISPMFLRIKLRRGDLPFGMAVKGRKRWSYYINRIRLEKWLAGEDLEVDDGQVSQATE